MRNNNKLSNVFVKIYLVGKSDLTQEKKIEFIKAEKDNIIKELHKCLREFGKIKTKYDYQLLSFYLQVLQDNIILFKDLEYSNFVVDIVDKLNEGEKYSVESDMIEIDKSLPISKYKELCALVPDFRTHQGDSCEFDYLFDYKSNYSEDVLVDPIFGKIQSEFVYDFKKGIRSIVLSLIIAYHLYRKYGELLKQGNVCICVIPSSTKPRCELRFQELINKVSYLLGIENGFELITRSTDRLDSREQCKKNIDVLEGVSFSSKLKGKTVILLDDVSTMGTSVSKFNDKLKEVGAHKVQSIVLAKTYYVRGNNLPMPELIELNKSIYNLL
ncbi:phosphoribosyltransferase [Myroides profundi]|uniref:Phosphoribosyl transferase domain-containing protein n=1 Tax=Myroides profundi TaxID=480520 RepID=A0AAJ5BE51_MYRPR|nr:phosphoribosyltransferase [Myroides profundi]AJH14525.1 hypothetical protein MPR_1343 [Myroides profundi]SEQ93813.1 Phosphoribosyl transferase domain-containing protein [Myroides profundi]